MTEETLTESEFEYILENMTVSEYMQLDELSKDTLKSYVKNSAVDLAGTAYSAGHKDGQGGPYSITGTTRKEDNRLKGIVRASDRLAK